MIYPDFFHLAPTILVHDGLAELLGASAKGRIEYGYPDVVKLSGHSCPTVAGAYLMTRKALQELYPDSLPERGKILVRLRGREEAGVTGVIAAVVSMITGAARSGGFKGIGGRFDRRNLLFFDVDVEGDIEFSNTDSSDKVQVSYHPEVVPPAQETKALLDAILTGEDSAGAEAEFARLWQDRVKRILLEHAEDPELIRVRRG